MKKLFLLAGWLLGAAATAQADPVARLHALQADPAALKAAHVAGQKTASFCAHCHGEDGVSKIPEVPTLAGQHPVYLLEQIRKFGSGERKDPFMQGLIKAMNDEERVQMALYYAANKVPPATGGNPALKAQGKGLFSKLCAQCHGEQAYGSEIIPRLAGQTAAYLRSSIIRYRDKAGGRKDPLMSAAATNLKNEEIGAIAVYLSQLP